MRISKFIIVFCLLSLSEALFGPAYAQIGMKELGDSLMAYTGFSPLWSPTVRVKNMRVNGDRITLYTNTTLRDYRWTPESLTTLKQKVSRWVLGHENGKVTIFSANTDISTLITECARDGIKAPGKCGRDKCTDLTERTIVLYPSHGLYYNRDRDEWIWQRATLWTTVEDLYSREYVRRVQQMLENAGATVLMPRAGLDNQQPGRSGMPQWTEGARYWLQAQGADSTLWDLYEGDEYKDDMKCRAMWINALDQPVDLCVALHTDGLDSGDDSTIVGTLVIYTAKDDDGHLTLRDGRDREKTNRNLADWIQTQLTSDLRTLAPEWTRRQLKEANYCESRVPVVPSIILELLSHKNMADMRYGLDPHFRFVAARAVYKGILRYLNGVNAIVQPLPVQDLGIRITNTTDQNSNAVMEWKPCLDSLEQSATPSYYMVYIRADEGEWDVQQVEKATSLKLQLKPGVKYDYYVVAGNDGGLSLPSPTISAYLSANSQQPTANSQQAKPVLIVDAFNDVYGPDWFADSTYAGIVPGSYACEDYFTCAYIGEQWNFLRTDLWVNDDNCGWGSCYRDHAGQFTIGNTHDWSAQHGRVLRQMNLSYVSCTAGMLTDQQPIANSQQPILLDLICGRQRRPLSDAAMRFIESHVAAGGRLLLSTDHFDAIDPAWAKRTLHASYYAAHATRNGKVRLNPSPAQPSTPGGRVPSPRFHLSLAPNDAHLFTANPQGLKPEKEAIRWATYEDMRVPAAVAFLPGGTSASENRRTLVFGFPIEAALDFDQLYRRSIHWLLEK